MDWRFQTGRPIEGVCYLDFLDVWLWQAIAAGEADRAYKYAREIVHWARQMTPDL